MYKDDLHKKISIFSIYVYNKSKKRRNQCNFIALKGNNYPLSKSYKFNDLGSYHKFNIRVI